MSKNKENSDEILVTKRTMEDVFKFQEKLRKLLESLILENRCLKPDEIDDYHYLIAHALLGQGVSKVFRIETPSGFIDLGTVEFMARWMARQTKTPVNITLPGSVQTHHIIIKFLWEKLLDYFFEIFPSAIEKSASMSRESDATIGGDGYRFDPKL